MNTSRTPPQPPCDAPSEAGIDTAGLHRTELAWTADAQREWQRQEAARLGGRALGRYDDVTGSAAQREDPLYRALARAAALPPKARLPADFAQRVTRRARRADAGDHFEVGLLAVILVLGGLLAAAFALPVLAEIASTLHISLPQAPQAGLPWALLGATALGLSGLLSGAIERGVQGKQSGG